MAIIVYHTCTQYIVARSVLRSLINTYIKIIFYNYNTACTAYCHVYTIDKLYTLPSVKINIIITRGGAEPYSTFTDLSKPYPPLYIVEDVKNFHKQEQCIESSGVFWQKNFEFQIHENPNHARRSCPGCTGLGLTRCFGLTIIFYC